MKNNFLVCGIGFVLAFAVGCFANGIGAVIEDCSLRVSTNGIIHNKNSAYYDLTHFEKNLCANEAVAISKRIKQVKFNY